MKLKGEISIMFDHDGLSIEITDPLSSTAFCKIRLNQEQTCKALSRLGHTDCEMELRGHERVGKKMEWKTLEFAMPEGSAYHDKKAAEETAKTACPEGWEMSSYFGSQESFFMQDGKQMARTTIRRWVALEDKPCV